MFLYALSKLYISCGGVIGIDVFIKALSKLSISCGGIVGANIGRIN